MDNKKGSAFGILLFFIVLIVALILGFVATLSWSVLDIASDEITPIMTELGMVGDTNLSQTAEYSFGTANTFVQAIPWLISFGYIMVIIFTIVFIFMAGSTSHPAFISFYFVLMVLLIFVCIIMSNIYQDIYTGTDEIASRLKEQSVMSYLILYSPFILSMIAVIGGILMFARRSSSEAGGFGV